MALGLSGGSNKDDESHTIVERLDADGNWVSISGIQKLSIEFDADRVLPIVKIERVLF